MRMIVTLFFSIAVLVSCSNEAGFDPLSEPPYDKLTDSISDEPSNAMLYYKRGQLLYANNQPVFASKDIRKAWELQPNETYALSLVTLLEEKSRDSAIAFLETATKQLPRSIALQVALAQAYQEAGTSDKALAVSEAIIAAYPGQLDALVLKAEILKEKDQMAEAVAVLEIAYSLAPGDVDVVHALAFAYAETGNAKTIALADSLVSVDLEKSHAEPYYFKGVYYANKGNSTEAVKQFDLAIQRNYNFTQAYINKGIVFYDKKQFGEAVKIFRLATTVAPTEAGPYYWLGRAEEGLGEKEAARLNYQRAFALDKSFSEAKAAADRLEKQ